ncbi:MAG: helix-turn-helix domain-containing protein [Cyclobacteriaceae bacterium]|jgi:AraC-like DNA-binding protein|nr:helix-turn-helix domain-containing protein [Flammeovirgaceae bacterium]
MQLKNFLDSLILLGAIQGFIISLLLYHKKEKLYANKLLAVILFLISLACLNLYILNQDIIKGSVFWNAVSLFIPLVIIMPIGPLIYFYVESLYTPDFKLNRSHRIHFVPIIIDFFPNLFHCFFIAGALVNLYATTEYIFWDSFIDQFNMYADFPRWVSLTAYTIFAWRKWIVNRKIKVLDWPKQFLISFAIFQSIWLLHLVPYLIPSLSDALLDWVGWYPVYVPLTVMVYWLGFNGYLKARPLVVSKSINPETVQETLMTLEKIVFQDRMFLNPELSLSDVVNATGIPQKTISSVLNQHAGKSFNEFVNQFRVEEVKKRLLESQPHLTITGIAFECGFNSQATFQRTFKQFTGVSPTEFLAQHQKKS